MPLAELFPGRDLTAGSAALARRAAEFGLAYGRSERLSNSRLAIEAAEFARDAGRFSDFHEELFAAYFARGEDIGALQVLREVARHAGLDTGALEEALTAGIYAPRREQVAAEARRLGFSGVPTFVFAEEHTVVGAQPLSVFRELLDRLCG